MQHRHCNNWPKPTGKVIRRCHSVSSKTIPISPIVELLKVSNEKYGQTLIVITHDESIALQADRILSIEDGKITRDEVIRR